MSGAGSPPDRASVRRWTLFLGLAAVIVVLDQLSKAWVDTAFASASPHAAPGEPGGPTRILGDLVRIAKVSNDGGIFGLFGASAPLLGAIGIVVVAGIVWYHARHGAQDWPLLTLALGFLLGGAVGNLIDRLRLGYVIDWVDTGLGDVRWYTFNVADAAIFIGLVLLIALGLLGDRLLPGRRRAVGSQRGPA